MPSTLTVRQRPGYHEFPGNWGPMTTSLATPPTGAASGVAEDPWSDGGLALRWLRPLGEGASAKVWEAADEAGTVYAVKVALRPEHAESLAAEAESLALTRARSLVRVRGGGWLPGAPPWDAGAAPGLPFLVLERVRGVPLAAWELMPSASNLLRDLVEALQELHGVGVAHGDLKPANVLVRRENGEARATLVDLGLSADLKAASIVGGTPRYLPPEIWSGEARGDGRARDLYALALTLAELLVPGLREAPNLREAVEKTPLPDPYERLLRPLLAEQPAARPSIRWLLSQARIHLRWSEAWDREQRRRTVRREYLRVRREELQRAAAARERRLRLEGAPRQWVQESVVVLETARRLRGLAPETESIELRDATSYERRRWLVGVIGPTAVGWPAPRESDAGLAQRLLDLAEQGPLEGVTRSRLDGVAPATFADEVASDPVSLALRVTTLPLDVRVLERIEALSDLHPELGVAAARAWRLRGEPARARLLASRFDVPEARLECALASRRLGDRERARVELLALEGAPPEILSLRAAQQARQSLDAGDREEARRLCETHVPTASLLEVRALLELACGDRAAARACLEEARALAASEEQQARLEGVLGMLEHAEGRPAEALQAFQRAALHAQRAGALLEEATYLTGVAAAATDQGRIAVALPAAERATLLFEALGRPGEAARAALARAAAYALVGAVAELQEAAAEAQGRARAAGDRICLGYVHLVLCDGLHADARKAAAHAEQAARELAEASEDDRWRAAARLLEHGLPVDVAAGDAWAASSSSVEARLEWWGARAAAMLAGNRSGRPEDILEALLALAGQREVGVARGQAFVKGARLALALARSEDARRLLSCARQAARELQAGTPDEHRRHLQALDWIALAETPEGNHFAPEQLAEIEALVRSLGTRERLKPLLERVLDALLLWTGVERGLLLLRAPGPSANGDEGDRLVVRAARNLAREDLHGVQLELSRSLARRALERGAPVVAVDAAGELPDVHQSVHALKLRSVLAVPLTARGEVQGVVYLDDRMRRGAFGPSELAWVKLVATLAAVAIADARDQLRLRRAARRAARAEARMAQSLARREAELELAARELERIREVRGDYSAIVGRSESMLELLRTVDRVAASEVPVLVQGESGSGKELIARALHDNGPRRGKPFVAENCAAIPEALLESTLFGHVRGAFTGAARQRAGLFEVAHGGTLFLDEIAEMPLAMQTKLLRVVQEGEIRPVGSERSRKVDVRIITATHRDLRERVEQGNFREDLFYRLNVIVLRVPPLRERAGDIPLLVQRFTELHGQGRKLRFDAEVLEALVRYDWPGNVRQLENEVRRLLVLTEGAVLFEHLSPEIQAAARLPRALDTLHVKTRVEALERELVQTALRRTQGNQTRAAELLGLSRFGLQKMMKRLEVGTGRSGSRRNTGRRSPGGVQESR